MTAVPASQPHPTRPTAGGTVFTSISSDLAGLA